MSTHEMVIKVWADDADQAESEISDALQNSIDSGNQVGWDTYKTPLHIDKNILRSDYKVKTFDELEKKLKLERKEDINKLRHIIKEDLQIALAPKYLTREDAVLFVGAKAPDEFLSTVEGVLKSKKDKKVSRLFDDLITNVIEALTESNSIYISLERLDQLECCAATNDSDITLQNSENHYAELPCVNEDDEDNKKGKFAYYFRCHRHY